jgi:glycosyltransferase involved in cell wall biosynthesis
MNDRPGNDGSPRFAVVIPTYNRADVVGRAVRSVLSQTVSDLELFVVVDGSTDATLDVLSTVSDPRLHVVSQANAGVSSARNAGIDASHAPLVAFLDDDDEGDPRWLELLGACFDDPDCQIACCGLQRIGPTRLVPIRMPRLDDWHDFESLFIAGTFMVRRPILESVGGYLPGLAFSENTDLGWRLGAAVRAAGGRIASVHEPLVIRHTAKSGTSVVHKAESVVKVIENNRARFDADPRRHAQWLAIAGVARARAGDFPGARRFFLQAWRARTRDLRHLGRYAVTWVQPLAHQRWDTSRTRE